MPVRRNYGVLVEVRLRGVTGWYSVGLLLDDKASEPVPDTLRSTRFGCLVPLWRPPEEESEGGGGEEGRPPPP